MNQGLSIEPMTPFPEISQINLRRPYLVRDLGSAAPLASPGSYRVMTMGVTMPEPDDASDIATEEFDLDGDDRPTSSLDFKRGTPEPAEPTAPPIPVVAERKPEASPEPTSEDVLTAREIGPGSVLRGRYLIEKAIGVGGTSNVFSALDRNRAYGSANSGANPTGRIAVKVLRSAGGGNDARVFRMEREFRQMQRLTHAGIVRVFDLDCEDDLWFITMELLEGEPLHRHLRAGVKDAEAFRILTQCAEALTYAHEHGVVHGDLKPSNVFVTGDGSIRLLDFGSAPDLNEETADPATQRFAATPAYASPETLEGKGVEPRDDLFSLGCLAYELLSGGVHPFDRKSSLDARQQNLRPPYVRSIRPRHFAVITKALSWERAARPASAQEFLHAFLASEFSREIAMDMPLPVDRPAAAPRFGKAAPVIATPQTAPAPASVSSPVTAPAPPKEKDDVEWIALPTQDVTPQPQPVTQTAVAETAAVQTDEHEPRPFSGFVPEEMLVRVEKNIATAQPSLHVSGLTESAPWIRRGAIAILIIAAVLTAIFLFGATRQTEKIAPATLLYEPESLVEAVASEPVAADPVEVEPAAEIAVAPAPAPIIPSAPGEVSFESGMVHVGSAQTMAVVNVTRGRSTRGAADVAWTTVEDTARAGVHYESVDSRITRFNDGQVVRSLFIPLKSDPAENGSRPARSFIVKLEKVAGGPALGAITQARVVIEGIE